MLERGSILVPVFLASQALLVHWAASSERPPAPPDLSRFPAGFSGWNLVRQNPIAADVQGELRADRLLSADYIHQPTSSSANLFVAWFQSQRAGASQPHSPKVCLPAAGWTPESTGEITLDTTEGSITVNRYIVAKGKERAVVLYWYQTPRRVVAGEWAAKLWLVADAVRDKRTDTALVRVIVWSTSGHDDQAASIATGFARGLHPLLRECLPNNISDF
jgi:EpsI family protein